MIVAENIAKSFEEVQALKGINFKVDDGELFGFIGPDGAGKTTLFRLITSLLIPDKGGISLNGYDIVKDYRKVRNIVGYMPGKFSLYTDLSVEENLQFFATVFGTSLKDNYDLIEDIYKQIEPFKKRLAGRLSGGMKQKLALSCALIHRPEILVLDEPTTGVDAVSRKEFWELLKGLKSKGITIVVSTPYMDEANMCERVALMQDGQIFSIDTPQNVVTKSKQIVYNVSAKNIYKLLNDLRKYPDCERAMPFGQGVHFNPTSDTFQQDALSNYLIQLEHTDIKVEKTTPDIEDVFIELVSRK